MSVLTCPICLVLLQEPRFLSCGHGFCRECIHSAFGVKRQCPICRVDVPRGDDQLKQIFIVDQAVEGFQSFTRERSLEVIKAVDEKERVEEENETLAKENVEVRKQVALLKRKLDVSENRVRHLREKLSEFKDIKKQVGKTRGEMAKLDDMLFLNESTSTGSEDGNDNSDDELYA